MREMEDRKSRALKYFRRIIAALSMIICVAVSMNCLQYYLSIPVTADQTRIIQFKKEPPDSIDVIMLGSSPTYSGFSSAYAYERFGFTSYPYAVGGSYCSMWKPAMQNILLTQKPKLVVVDVFGGGYDLETGENRKLALYLISNTMPYSAEKFRMAREASRHMDTGDAVSLAFPFVRYHSNFATNLKNIKERMAIESYGPSPMKGVEVMTKVKKLKPLSKECFTADTEPLDKKTAEIIRSFIKYCRAQNVDMLFVKYPSRPTYEEDFMANMRQNSVLELARSEGCKTLDLERNFNEVGLNLKTDFYNRSHTNHRGQRKLTKHLGAYIQNNMGIGPSHLKVHDKNNWDKAADYYNVMCEMSEEMIQRKKTKFLSDSPELVAQIEQYKKEKR